MAPNRFLVPENEKPRVLLSPWSGKDWSFDIKGGPSTGKPRDLAVLVVADRADQPQSISRSFDVDFSFQGKVCQETDCFHILILDCLGLGQIRWVFRPEKK